MGKYFEHFRKKGHLENKNWITTLKSNINTYYQSKAETARIRSKINVFEKEERSTKWLYYLENKNRQESLWANNKTEGKVSCGRQDHLGILPRLLVLNT